MRKFTWFNGFAMAAGVFVGNWLLVPMLREKTFHDSFYIGLIAAVLTLVFYSIVRAIESLFHKELWPNHSDD
jgi:uncharacterized membrane protein YfcA